MKKRIKYLCAVLCVLSFSMLNAQEVENEFQTRLSADFEYDLVKHLDVYFSPEFRLDQDYSLDEYHLNLGLDYKVLDVLSVGAKYGFIANLKENSDTEYLGRYSVGATLKERFGRFTPSARIMYSNYADDEVDDKQYLRYKAGVKYDIKSCKITPYATFQVFRELKDNDLYKMRYALGASYKIKKNNTVSLGYKMDYFYTDYLNKHIVEISYNYKF